MYAQPSHSANVEENSLLRLSICSNRDHGRPLFTTKTRRTWKKYSADSYSITTVPVFISRWMGARLLKLVANINHYPQN